MPVVSERVVYACTFVEKTAEVDDFKKGCVGARQTVFAERCDVEAGSLEGLLAALSERFFLDIDSVWAPPDEEDGSVTRLGYNRLETEDGSEPTPVELRLWKKGQLTLYLCDYEFRVEHRCVRPLELQEFAGVKHYA